MDQSELNALLNTLKQLDEPSSASAAPITPSYSTDALDNVAPDALQKLFQTLQNGPPAEAVFDEPPTPDWDYNPSAQNDWQPPTPISKHDEEQEDYNDADLRFLTFAEALPHISKLAADHLFRSALQETRKKQDDLERQIKQERDEKIAEFHSKIKAVQQSRSNAKAADEHRLRQELKSTLLTFDKQALERWDAIIPEQQAILQKMGVPSFHQTRDQTLLDRQARVLKTLLDAMDE